MKLKSETITSGLLSGLLSGLGAIIGGFVSKIVLPDNFALLLFSIIGSLIGLSIAIGLLILMISLRKNRKMLLILKRDQIKDKRLEGEVFMIELLQKPIILRKDINDKIINIDRSEVEDYIISGKGKEKIVELYVENQRNEIEILDNKIQLYLSNIKNSIPEISLNERFKLRWASGGVLSVIKYLEKKWIPFFFRDIRPYGWNISLGASERQFDLKNIGINSIDEELKNPISFIVREFLEETLIIHGKIISGKNHLNSLLNLILPHGVVDVQQNPDIQFASKHIRLRGEYDEIQISPNFGGNIKVREIPSNMSLNISGNKKALGDILVCFSLLDLGIEVVKLFEYTINDKFELLDGEILEKFDGHKMTYELTRMPVALISCEFLSKVFSENLTTFDYTAGPNPSIKIKETMNSDKGNEDIILFDWDIIKRMEIITGKIRGVGDEKSRYTTWYDKFGENFVKFNRTKDNFEIIRNNPSKLFTPATSKILNIFFRNISPEVWQVKNNKA